MTWRDMTFEIILFFAPILDMYDNHINQYESYVIINIIATS